MLRSGDVKSVEKELEKVRGIVKECINTNDVCAMRNVDRKSRKESEWWNEEVGVAVSKKNRTFEQWLQRQDWIYVYDRYQSQRAV